MQADTESGSVLSAPKFREVALTGRTFIADGPSIQVTDMGMQSGLEKPSREYEKTKAHQDKRDGNGACRPQFALPPEFVLLVPAAGPVLCDQ